MYRMCENAVPAGQKDKSGVDENDRLYVDLGLPSGTLWANMNFCTSSNGSRCYGRSVRPVRNQ